MKKLAKTLLSLALALAVVLSLGVCAFADGADAGEENVETVDIAFDLSSAIGCALLMRSVDYDDIRLNGIRYQPDAADGVMLVRLGDLAAAKLLTDYAAEAQAAGLDLSKLYISAGRVHVDKTGMTAEDAADLSAAVDAFMSSYKTAVSIGDVFSLANGAQLKLKLCVVNFWYSSVDSSSGTVSGSTEKKETKLDFVAFTSNTYSYDNNGNFNTINGVDWKNTAAGDYFNYPEGSNYPSSIKTPEVTTVFFQYYSADNTGRNNFDEHMQTHVGWVGIAKAADDTNDYYVKVIFAENDAKFYNGENEQKYMDDTTFPNKDYEYSIRRSCTDNKGGFDLATNVEIYTDSAGKNLVYEIKITEDTATLDDVQNRDDYDYLENPKLKTAPNNQKLGTDGKVAYVPDEYVEETHDEKSADVTVRGAIRCWNHNNGGDNGKCTNCGYIEPVTEPTSITDPPELTTTSAPAPTTPTETPNTTTTTPTTDPNTATASTTPTTTTTTTPEPTTPEPAGNTESTPSAA